MTTVTMNADAIGYAQLKDGDHVKILNDGWGDRIYIYDSSLTTERDRRNDKVAFGTIDHGSHSVKIPGSIIFKLKFQKV